ncbi:hypothetical protein MHB84_05110 [Paenibacillus sp. FSL F4-0087]|uniref:hypothetical protein n=1 Tax=Paenibacillus sp. FSL F4-0087 TaxID=2921368 RepID=UPI00096E0594|nr:hypothetical protein BK122_17465 [Paenibacillus pabuli]
MSKNFSKEELINMDVNTFKSQLGEHLYTDYIQYLIRKHKKPQIGELSSYCLDLFSDDHEKCRQSIGHEIESIGTEFWRLKAKDVFDLVGSRFNTWDEAVTDSQIIDMFQNISFLYAASCYINKNFSKSIGVKIGIFS